MPENDVVRHYLDRHARTQTPRPEKAESLATPATPLNKTLWADVSWCRWQKRREMLTGFCFCKTQAALRWSGGSETHRFITQASRTAHVGSGICLPPSTSAAFSDMPSSARQRGCALNCEKYCLSSCLRSAQNMRTSTHVFGFFQHGTWPWRGLPQACTEIKETLSKDVTANHLLLVRQSSN